MYQRFKEGITKFRQAILEIDQDTSIIIKPADKGGGIVILDSAVYNQECKRLLSDVSSYKVLTTNPTERLTNKIRSIVYEAETQGWITQLEADFLVNRHPVIPYFYCLPKIHKGINPPPGRPIVSGINSLLEPLSKFCDAFLKPLVQKTSTYLKDTKEVLNLIHHLNSEGPTNFLITLDVEALYTSIPQDATLNVVESFLLNSNLDSITPANFILECASIALKENFFQFENNFYLQTSGTSMGSTFAPSLACLYMFNFETTHILNDANPFRPNITTWKRYIDDVLITWNGTYEQASTFFQWLNGLDSFLRFTSHISHEELPFLDLMISIDEGTLNTRTYNKPTDRNSLLNFESFHPRALKSNLPYGQFLRLRRNCNNVCQYREESTHLQSKLKNKGYPKKMIKTSMKRALNANREALLDTTVRTTSEALTCVTTFTPISNTLQKIIRKRWHILN